jgi:hypothetical protein
MKDLFDKLSSYNLFNNFLPGLLFCLITPHVSNYSLVQTDVITGIFVYYFVGLVIGRIGSIVLEPILKKIAKFSEYDKYVSASKKDQKIELLSELNNSYRNYIAVVVSLFAWSLYSFLSEKIAIFNELRFIILGSTVLLLIVFSLIKQTAYIRKRIDLALKE